MKVLTLRQPWASMVVTEHPDRKEHRGIKSWETRRWRPSSDNFRKLYAEGLLIHAAGSILGLDWQRLDTGFFRNYRSEIVKEDGLGKEFMPLGVIIGWVKVGMILSTQKWVSEFRPSMDENYAEEMAFGDYRPGRWAWNLLEPVRFKVQIPFRGSLTLSDYNADINIYQQ